LGDASEKPTIRITRLENARIFCFAWDDVALSFAFPGFIVSRFRPFSLPWIIG